MVVFGRQVYRVDNTTVAVEQPARAGQEDNLVGLQHLDEFVGGEIGIDVEDLPGSGLSTAGDDRDRSCMQARFDGCEGTRVTRPPVQDPDR